MHMKKERNIFMTNQSTSSKNKTIHELAKEFPNKTYTELEKYRDADRREEAQRIITQQENAELKENQLTESEQRQMELEPIEKENQYYEDWKKKYKKEHKLRLDAELETSLVKAIGQNSPEMKAAKQKIEELQNSMDRLGKENSELYNRIADLTENPLKKARESGL